LLDSCGHVFVKPKPKLGFRNTLEAEEDHKRSNAANSGEAQPLSGWGGEIRVLGLY